MIQHENEVVVDDIQNGALVHGVNCMGAMGSGIARFLMDKHPEIFTSYRLNFDRNTTEPYYHLLGKIDPVLIDEDRDFTIINAFTQVFYGKGPVSRTKFADASAIQSALGHALNLCSQHDLDLYMPKIGCGLGGLAWETDVKPVVETIAQKAMLDGVRLIVVENFK